MSLNDDDDDLGKKAEKRIETGFFVFLILGILYVVWWAFEGIFLVGTDGIEGAFMGLILVITGGPLAFLVTGIFLHDFVDPFLEYFAALFGGDD